MRKKKFPVFASLILFTIFMSGCTHEAWYDGVKEGAKNNCQSQPQSEVEACMQRLNTKTYEEYEKERSGQK